MVQLVLPVVLLMSLQLADSNDVRLVGGASHCEGELQVKHLNRWREVHIEEFLLLTAASVCRRLNCGSAVSHERRDRSSHSAVELDADCVQSSSSLSQCVRDDDLSSDRYYSIICSDSVRLLHGSSQCSGSLEVKRMQSWTLVCEEDFDLKDAEVVCRELGCGEPFLLQGALYIEGFAPVRQMFQCEGHESALMDCPRSSVIQNNCPSFKAVLLSCSEPLRLTGGPDACAGTLEIRHRAQWRPVFVKSEPQIVATKACHLQGCGTPLSANFTYSSRERPLWDMSLSCIEKPSLFKDCLYIKDTNDTRAVKVKCSGKPNYLFLLWLVPAVTVIIVALTVLTVCKRKTSSSNAQETTTRSEPCNPENVEYENASMFEDHVYQNLIPGAMDPDPDPEYIELHPEPLSSKQDAVN